MCWMNHQRKLMRHLRWPHREQEEEEEQEALLGGEAGCCKWHHVATMLRGQLEGMVREGFCDPRWRWYHGWQCDKCGAVHEEKGEEEEEELPTCAICECQYEGPAAFDPPSGSSPAGEILRLPEIDPVLEPLVEEY